MDKVDQFLRVGELAKLTGITVRTLHYYDEIGLLKPSKITEAGHRLYDLQSVATLYQIISLKDMGFPLKEIKSLLREKSMDITRLIDIQISKVQEEIAQKQLFYRRLLKLKQEINNYANISIDHLKEIIPFIHSSADRYLTKEQLTKIKKNLERNQAESNRATKWIEFITKLHYCYQHRLPKTDKKAIECINYWNELVSQTIGKDQELKNSIFSFHASQTGSLLRYGLSDELYSYLMKLMK